MRQTSLLHILTGLVTATAMVITGCAHSPGGAPAPRDLPSAVDALAEQLAQKIAPEPEAPPLSVAVYDFPCNNPAGEGISELSTTIQACMAQSVTNWPSFELITRAKLGEWVAEGDLQASDLVDNSTPSKQYLKKIKARIHGSYSYVNGKLTVFASLDYLEGGQSHGVRVSLPYNAPVKPVQKPAEQKLNRRKVEQLVGQLPNTNVVPEIWVAGGRNQFRGGEKIKFCVRVDRDCYIAVICHQVDGASAVLLPNEFSQEIACRAGTIVTIGNTGEPPYVNEETRGNFEIPIMAPYGADIVQVLACTNRASLEAAVRNVRQSGPGYLANEIITDRDGDWGQAYIVVHTFAP